MTSTLARLPTELLGVLCDNMPCGTLVKLARTCTAVRDFAETRIWRHLVLGSEEIKSLPNWRARVYNRYRWFEGYSHNDFRKLLSFLYEPHIAAAVHHVTMSAAPKYSNKFAQVLNELAFNLRHLSFQVDRLTGPSILYEDEPWKVGLDAIFETIVPMQKLVRLDLVLPSDWGYTWCRALEATPFLQELSISGFPTRASADWTEPERMEPFGAYAYPSRAPPSCPYLQVLKIKGMNEHLEDAVQFLVEGSVQKPFKLILEDYGSWKSSWAFRKFVEMEGDRLIIEMSLPPECLDEIMMFWEKSEEEDRAYREAWWKEQQEYARQCAQDRRALRRKERLGWERRVKRGQGWLDKHVTHKVNKARS